MDITTINQIIAASAGLTGALIGAGISGWVTHRISKDNHNIEKQSLAAGFIAEINALQTIISVRGYLEAFQNYANHPDIINGDSMKISIIIPDNYARFYNANVNKVGLLGPEKTPLVIRYHQFLQSISFDFRPGSYIQENGFNTESINETIRMLKEVKRLGDQITS